MSDFLLHTAVRMRITVTGIVEGLADRIASDERGQDTIEYLGVLLVVAALIGVVVGLVPGLKSTITDGAKSVISGVFGAGSNE